MINCISILCLVGLYLTSVTSPYPSIVLSLKQKLHNSNIHLALVFGTGHCRFIIHLWYFNCNKLIVFGNLTFFSLSSFLFLMYLLLWKVYFIWHGLVVLCSSSRNRTILHFNVFSTFCLTEFLWFPLTVCVWCLQSIYGTCHCMMCYSSLGCTSTSVFCVLRFVLWYFLICKVPYFLVVDKWTDNLVVIAPYYTCLNQKS